MALNVFLFFLPLCHFLFVQCLYVTLAGAVFFPLFPFFCGSCSLPIQLHKLCSFVFSIFFFSSLTIHFSMFLYFLHFGCFPVTALEITLWLEEKRGNTLTQQMAKTFTRWIFFSLFFAFFFFFVRLFVCLNKTWDWCKKKERQKKTPSMMMMMKKNTSQRTKEYKNRLIFVNNKLCHFLFDAVIRRIFSHWLRQAVLLFHIFIFIKEANEMNVGKNHLEQIKW